MDCDCSLEGAGDENEYYTAQIRKARKPHICCECKGEIKPGTNYEHVTLKSDGSWDCFKTCEICLRIRKRFCSGGWFFGQLVDQVYCCVGINYVTGELNDDFDEIDTQPDLYTINPHR